MKLLLARGADVGAAGAAAGTGGTVPAAFPATLGTSAPAFLA